MLSTANSLLPKLSWRDPEIIAEGVKLKQAKFLLQQLPPFNASCFEVLPGCSSPLDHHVVAECWLIIQGQGELIYDGKEYAAIANDFFYFESFKAHQIKNSTTELLLIFSIYW